MNILLVCANGASTGVLVEKMKSFCSEHEKLKTKTINIEAIYKIYLYKEKIHFFFLYKTV